MEHQRYHEIQIRPVLNGFHVQVGCQDLVYTDGLILLQDLREYFLDPGKKEQEMRMKSWKINGGVMVTPETPQEDYRAKSQNLAAMPAPDGFTLSR